MAGEGSLSVQTALAAQKVKGAWTLKRLMLLLDSLAKYDIEVEKKKSKSGVAMALFGVGAIVVGIAWAVSEYNPLGYLMAISAILFVFSWISYGHYSRKDIPNDFREYLIPLLKLLSGDIEDKSKIALNMDIAQLRNKKYSKGAQSWPPKAPYNKITSECFERPLVTMAIRLHDGNRLLMERSESLTVITKRKKNPRGKTKTKEKLKRRVFTRMKLAVNGRVYAVRKTFNNPTGAQVSSKKGANRITIDMKLAEKGGMDVAMRPDSSVRQLAFLYSCIAPVNRGDNRAS